MPTYARVTLAAVCVCMAIVSVIAMLTAPRDGANWSLAAAIWCMGIALCGRGE